MKNELVDDLSVFVSSNEKIFDIELQMIIPPFPTDKEVLSSKEYLLVNLFRYLRSFYDLLNKARENLNLQSLFDFPVNFTMDSYLNLLQKLTLEQRSTLEEWRDKILKRYSLLKNWDVSICVVILTHHFTVPYPDVPISYYLPPTKEQKELERNRTKTLRTLFSDPNIFTSWGLIEHPAIYFNTYTTPTSLIKWVREHKYIFPLLNRNLEKNTATSSRMTMRTFRVGEMALIIKWGNKKRWCEMEEMIDKWDKKEDYGDYWGEEGIPTAEELRIAFKSLFNVISSLNSGNSESL